MPTPLIHQTRAAALGAARTADAVAAFAAASQQVSQRGWLSGGPRRGTRGRTATDERSNGNV